MNKDVKIYIKGTQTSVDTGEQDTIETRAVGSYFSKENHDYLLFEERDEELKASVKTTLKFNENRLEQTKKGHSNSYMIFEEGISHSLTYTTPYGPIAMTVKTDSFSLTKGEKEISMCIKYDMEMNDSLVSKCEIQIIVSST